MRRKKMAGNSKFLLGKNMSSEELLASRKRKPSQLTFTNHLLHSKSTYFYRWGSGSGYSYTIPVACGLALLVGLGVMLNPTTRNNMLDSLVGSSSSAYAVSDDECQTTANDKGFCAMELGIMMNNTNDTFTEVPATTLSTAEATFRDYSFSVRAVDTRDGYKLYANAISITGADGVDYTNQLVNMDDPKNSVIVPITGEVAGSAIPAGQWGYAFTKGDNIMAAPGTLTYKAVPTGTTENSQPIDTGTDTTYDSAAGTHTDMNYKLYFGARASDGMRSGHYRTQVQLSLVADPKSIVKTMQKFAEAATTNCTNLDKPKQLEDSRDGKRYWVSKINGQCMMTQNLDLDIPATGLSKDDTDLNGGADWSVSSSSKPVATLTGTTWTWNVSNNAIVQSYDPGEYIINQATSSWTNCNTTKDPSACNRYAAITSSTADTDLHYAVGNYYSYNAATAGTGASATSSGAVARDSICPKGWKLIDNSGTKSFGTILSGKNQTTIRQDPVYFLAAGYAVSSGLDTVGSKGYYWSSTSVGSSSANILLFASNLYDPTNNGSRYSGYSVRCVLR